MARERRNRRNGSNGRSGVPPPWLSGWFDPELKDLFEQEPELYETAHLLRSSRPEAAPDEQYRRRLRAALMTEAEGTVGRRSALRRWFLPGPRHLAWGGAAAGVALVAATALVVFSTHMQDHQTVTAVADVAALHSVSPDKAVTVAFNQPMDHAAVVAGLRIQPATEVTTAWEGNSLVITPVHHFAGNTPYTVSIARANLRTSIGTVAAAPLEITFGTAATPPPTGVATSTPALEPAQLGQAAGGSDVSFAPDGSVVALAGLAGSAAPSAPPSGSATPTAAATATASPPGATAAGASVPAGPALIAYSASGGQPRVLGKTAEAAGFSPDGSRIAAAEASGEGAGQLIVAAADGSSPSVLATIAGPVVGVAWESNSRILYATSDAIHTIDLSGVSTQVTLPSGAGPVTRLSPDGRYAYLAPSGGTGGTLLDIAGGATRTLAGSVSQVAFSGDGGTVVWVDQSAAKPRLLVSPVDRDAPAPVSTLDPGSPITLAAVDRSAGAVAYSVTGSTGGEQLVVAQLPSGAALALGPATHTAAFAPQGGHIAYLVPGASGDSVELAPIPGYVPPPTTVPEAATDALSAFVSAQIAGDASRMHDLAGTGFDPVALTPQGLSRAYTIAVSSPSPGRVTADVDLVVDPTSHHLVPRVAVEALHLSETGDRSGYVVSSMDVSPLQDQAAGPHVVRVASGRSGSRYVIQVAFDSDLTASSVPGAITVLDHAGTVLAGTTVYDANTRIATVSLDSAPAGPVTVNVGTSLMDVSGQPLAAPLTAVTGG